MTDGEFEVFTHLRIEAHYVYILYVFFAFFNSVMHGLGAFAIQGISRAQG